MKPLYIVFEGTEFGGKSTQSKLLKEFFDKQGIEYVENREPGGTAAGKDIRDILLNKDYSSDLSDTTQALLFAASYRDALETKVIKAIEEGKCVVSDRTNITAYVYQRKSPVGRILYQINDNLKRPDVVFILTTNYETLVERRKALRGDTNYRDLVNEEQHNWLLDGYGEYIATHQQQCVVLDATLPIEEIHQHVIDKLNSM